MSLTTPYKYLSLLSSAPTDGSQWLNANFIAIADHSLSLSGGTMTGDINVNSHDINNVHILAFQSNGSQILDDGDGSLSVTGELIMNDPIVMSGNNIESVGAITVNFLSVTDQSNYGLASLNNGAVLIGDPNSQGNGTYLQLADQTFTASFNNFHTINFGSAALVVGGSLTLSTQNIITDTTTGTKIGTATNQKLGFFNVTPIVQPNTTGTVTGFTAATGSAVLAGSTFTGNTGSTAYTISDIVFALKKLGLMTT